MKFVLAALFGLMGTGCATAIPYSGEEECAAENMILTGKILSYGGGQSYTPGVGVTQHYSQSTGVSCAVPTSDADRCLISSFQNEMEPKASYNENIKSKRLVTGLGYVFWIAPGILAKVLYDNQRDAALSESLNRRQAQKDSCK